LSGSVKVQKKIDFQAPKAYRPGHFGCDLGLGTHCQESFATALDGFLEHTMPLATMDGHGGVHLGT
jgi:hypothetical protein